MSAIDEQEFHWLVGILEGEGTFLRGAPSAPGLPIVRVSMTDRDVVERVAAALGRAVVALRPRQPHHKRPYATTVKGAPAAHLMKTVRPFLGRSRQAEIDRALVSWHGRPARRLSSGDVPLETFRPELAGTCTEDCEVSWLAGLLEGEGSFGLTRRSPLTYPVVSLQMCDEDIVVRASRLLGATAVHARKPRYNWWSLLYVTRITGDQAALWMRQLRDRMGLRRSEAIETALSAYSPIRLAEVPTTCVVPDCRRPHRSRGLCHAHYMSWSRDRAKGRTPRITPLR